MGSYIARLRQFETSASVMCVLSTLYLSAWMFHTPLAFAAHETSRFPIPHADMKTTRLPKFPGPYLDMHTHLTGALSGSHLVEVFRRNNTRLDLGALDGLGIPVRKKARSSCNGANAVALDDIDTKSARRSPAQILLPALRASHGGFERFEHINAVRRAALEYKSGFFAVLGAIAEMSQLAGVRYLSLSSEATISQHVIGDPGGLLDHLNKLEARTGVRLRLLHGFSVYRSEAHNKDLFDKARASGLYEKNSPVVGIDLHGEESSSLEAYRYILELGVEQRQAQDAFQVASHCAELKAFAKNTALALEIGVNQLQHGVFGVTDASIAMAKDKGAVFAPTPGGSEMLGYLDRSTANEYYRNMMRLVEADVPITLGSDGAGIFGRDVPDGIARVHAAVTNHLGHDEADALVEHIAKTNSALSRPLGLSTP